MFKLSVIPKLPSVSSVKGQLWQRRIFQIDQTTFKILLHIQDRAQDLVQADPQSTSMEQ